MRKYDGGWPNMLEARACWWVDGMRLGSTVSDDGLTACCTRASAEVEVLFKWPGVSTEPGVINLSQMRL